MQTGTRLNLMFELLMQWLHMMVEGKRIENEYERHQLRLLLSEHEAAVMFDREFPDGFEEEWE